eukprot:g10971.t1
MRASRMSRRKVVMGIWVVSGGEAITVSVYDPKAVQSLEITFLCGWWAELGIPPLKSMAISGLCGVAAYLVQGISLHIPEPDRKGRVDMTKASLRFNPGPPPPLFEFGPSQFDSSKIGERKAGGESRKGDRAESHVVWRGMRTFRQRAVLLACARNGPSVMIVRGWDSSMDWRMTNVVTFHEEDWKTWKEVAEPAKVVTAPYFSSDTPPETQNVSCSSSQSPTSEGQDRSRKCQDIRQSSGTTPTATSGAGAPDTELPPADDKEHKSSSSRAGGESTNPGSAGANAASKKHPAKSSPSFRSPSASATATTDRARNDRLCQAIADRVEARFEGRGGKLALRAPRRRGDGSGGHRGFGGGLGGGGEGTAGLQGGEDDDEDGDDNGGGNGGGDSDGDLYDGGAGVGGGRGLGSDEIGSQEQGKDASIPRQFLSHKAMEERLRSLDVEEDRTAIAGGPRRPLEDADSGMDEFFANLPGARSVKALARRRGANGKMRTVEEIVEQLAINRKREEALAAARRQEAVRKWKSLGKVLCRLLRMSDYWYGFASDGALLSSEERATRRISVLQQIVEMRGVGRTTMKSIVRAIAEMDNLFFKYTTAGWPFSRLVDLTSDARLVKKPTLSVLYEEGETAPRVIGGEVSEPGTPGAQASLVASGSVGQRTSTIGVGNIGRMSSTGAAGRGGGGGRVEEQGTHPSPAKREQQQQDGEKWAVGAYVIIGGSVDLYVLERGPAAKIPTAASQEDLAAKASRGQPMFRPRPPAEWEAADGEAEADEEHGRMGAGALGRRQRLVASEHFEVTLSGSGPGPRRARTRNVAPRWKACRLGAGALFGDRPMQVSTTAGLQATWSQTWRVASKTSAPAPAWSSGAALETAITADETELLEIGVTSYRRFLAKGVRERTNRAVAVLKATKALDGVPAPALARICRYATERTAGRITVDAAHPPLLNPAPGALPARSVSQLAFRCNRESEANDDGESDNNSNSSNGKNNDNNRGNIMCQKGTFRGTVFFIGEGHGDVVVGALDESVGLPRGQGGDGGGSSTESLLAAAAFGNRRNCTKKYERSRPRHGDENGDRSNCERLADGHRTSVGHVKAGAETAVEPGPAAGMMATPSGTGSERKETRLAPGDQKGFDRAGSHPTEPHADDSLETAQAQSSHVSSTSAAIPPISLADGLKEDRDWDSDGGGEEERCSRLAALKRGDFFGVDPVLPSTTASSEGILPRSSRFIHGACSNADADSFTAPSPPNLSPDTMVSAAAGGSLTKSGTGEARCRSRGPLAATDDPLAIVAEPSAVPPPTFPGLHMASLVAGPSGMRCLAVGLAVLQKICPPVHRRLEKAAVERYSGWMTEAKRRNEDDWNESLENESVCSLSRAFYDSYAKGHCSGSVAGKGATDMDSSIGWTIGDDGGSAGGGGGGGGRRSGGSFEDSVDGPRTHGDGEDGATIQAPASIVRSLLSVSTSASESKSIFEMSRRYNGLALCSSGRTVVPVRLGGAIAEATAPLKASLPANQIGNGRLGVRVPPTRVAAAENAENAGVARRICPHTSAGVAMVPQVGRRSSAAPTPTAYGNGGGGGGGVIDTYPEKEGSSSRQPIENDRQTYHGEEPAASVTPLPHSPFPTCPGVDATCTAAETTTINNDQDAGSVGDSCCSRGRRCGANPTRERSASSERLGGGAEIGVLLAKCHRNETYNCPVSPFSMPPSWADVPPLATIEPPGFPPPCKVPTAVVKGARVERGKGGPLEGGDSSMSLQVAQALLSTTTWAT